MYETHFGRSRSQRLGGRSAGTPRRSRLGIVASVGVFALLLEAPTGAHAQCLANESAKLIPSETQSTQFFGFSVGVSGNVAVVGGFEAERAYIYRFDGTNWNEQAEVEGTNGDALGWSVAVDGDVVVVAEPGNDGAGENAGVVFIYRFDPPNWVLETVLTATDVEPGDIFGHSVALSGSLLVVGASEEDEGGLSAGAAYVFRFDPVAQAWVEEAKLVASDPAAFDRFGAAVDVDGEVVLVGAPQDDDDDGTDAAGSVYVFRREGIEWVQETKLTASNPSLQGIFGASVAVEADVALVGAPSGQFSGSNGSAYIFRFDGREWTEEAALMGPELPAPDMFGYSVAIRRDVAVVGTPMSFKFPNWPGSAHVYRFDGLEWLHEAVLRGADTEEWDFGWSVSMSGDIVLAGSITVFGSAFQSGAAYIFRGVSDCNATGTLDICDIVEGQSDDLDENGIPDECQGGGDFDADGDVDFDDLGFFRDCYTGEDAGPVDLECMPGDFDFDTDIDRDDYISFREAFTGPK